jgi:cyclic-di-GMP phosphodiesterase TipF (flagellum assembly factor)
MKADAESSYRDAPVQSLVYMFIVLAGLGVGATVYFGLTFSAIESFVVGLAFCAIAVILVERTLRRRAEARLERAIEDLSRLLSTDAQAGAVLGQRINALTDIDAGRRLDAVEADVSVLGTVVRQVAEAVADLENAQRRQGRRPAEAAAATSRPAPARRPAPATPPAAPAGPSSEPVPRPEATTPAPPAVPAAAAPEPRLAAQSPAEPVIPVNTLQQALEENRLVVHLQPIITLPQRKAHGYDLVPRLALDEGELADPPDFLPRKGGEEALRRIERQLLEEALTIARRSKTAGQPVQLYLPLSHATLLEAPLVDNLAVLLEANRAVASGIVLTIGEEDWAGLPMSAKGSIATLLKKGVGLSLADARSLRLDYTELAAAGVGTVRFSARRFTEDPESLTDFHTSDVADYVRRYELELIATGVETEDQLLTLLEDGIRLAQGPHIAPPGPARADLVANRPGAQTAPHRAQA